jgi:DNA-binding NarL/FixJ family response regulator
VVIFSSSSDETEVRECHRRGASAYVVKPSTIASHVAVADAIERFWVRVARIRS